MTTVRPCNVPTRIAERTPVRRVFARGALLRSTALVGTLAGLSVAAPFLAHANPVGGSVAAGSAVIQQTAPNQLNITQSTNSAIINWQGFSIGSNEATVFQQPSSSSVTLNRVTGPGGSDIDGSLRANGMIFLINPNGVVFGPNAQVNVNGLVATTADTSDRKFMAGQYRFDRPSHNPNATVENQGTITIADGGLAALVAPGVANSGTITARSGRIALGGALTFGLDLYGDGLLYFDTNSKVTQAPVDATGKPVAALVQNSGTIRADGGTVTLTATAATQLLDQVINTSGVIEARSFAMKDGTIVLSGSGGAVVASGTLDASGNAPGETGGTVKVLGDEVAVMAGATIDASGNAGGGTVLIGGDRHGAGPDPNSAVTYVAATASIKADARETGNGGNVVVWSDEYTEFDGSISATGGASGGNGGTVEVSSHNVLDFTGLVDLSAANGTKGILLLDPADIDIENNAGTNSGIAFDGEELVYTPDDTTEPSILDTGVLEAQLANTSVAVSTQTAGTIAGSGGITVVAGSPLAWASGTTLTLASSGNITIAAPITATNGSALVLQAEQQVVVSAPITAASLAVSGTGTNAITLGSNITTLGATTNGLGDPYAQEYQSPVILGSNVTLTDNAGGSILFNSSIDAATAGTQSLTINALGAASVVYFEGSIGNIASPDVITVTAPILHIGPFTNIFTTGGFSQTGATVLEAAEGTTVHTIATTGNSSTGADITFAGPIDGSFSGGQGLTLSAGTGTVTLQGNVGATAPLAVFYVEAAKINLGAVGGGTGISVTTAGTFGSGDCQCGQQYDGPVVLNGNATLTDLSGNFVNFNSTVDSGSVPSSLTVNAQSTGEVEFPSNVGSAAPLTSLSVTAGQIDLGVGLYFGNADPAITTSGSGQTYTGAVFVLNDTTFTDTGSGAITFTGTVDSIVDEVAPNGVNMTVVTKGAVTFDAAVGGSDPFYNLTVTGGAIAFDGSVTVNNNIVANTAAAAEPPNGSITLGSGVTLTASGTGTAILIEAGSDHAAGDPTGGDFENNSGANALVTPGGNWVVYSGNPIGQGTVDGGLTYTTLFDYDTTFTPTPAGNYFVFRGGFLTLTPNAVLQAYNGTALDNPTYSDNLANYAVSSPVVGGNPPVEGATLSGSMAFNGSATTVVQNAGTYSLSVGTLTVNSSEHLGLAFTNPTPNNYVITPAGLTVTPNGSAVTYNATALDTVGYSDNLANYTISGLVTGQTPASAGITLTGAMNFNLGGTPAPVVENAGTYVLAQGSLSGTSTANNYTISFSNPSGNSYVINQLPVVLAGTRTYDATANAPASILTISNNLDGGNLTLSGTGTLVSANAPSEVLQLARYPGAGRHGGGELHALSDRR